MKASLTLGKAFGIRIQMHWTFLLIILWAMYMGWQRGGTVSAMLWMIAFVLAIFACVVLHELGHALTARRYQIDTRKITLLPIGGVASLDRIPEEPQQELWVAVMGPAVNVVIAMLLFPLVQSRLSVLTDPEAAMAFFQTVSSENFLTYLFITNIFLVVFNAIPAFPMDGGRILRALLSFRMDRVKATQIASNLGQIIAIFFFFIGFTANPILIFIGLFVFFGASSEYQVIQQMSLLKGHSIHEAMMTQYTQLYANNDLKTVGDLLLSGTERNFVVTDGQQVIGILPHTRIVKAFQQSRRDLRVAELMERDFQKVEPWEDLSEIYRKVQGKQQHFFPVIQSGVLVGVIDMENIQEFMMIQAGLDY